LSPSVPGDFDKECFFIAPIGEDGSDIRKRSNGVRDWVVKPAAKQAADLTTVRADDVGEPGQITAQAVQHCLKAKAAVADLTGGNPNVYYELSVRHGALLPVVLIAEEGTKLPFDISQSRVIFFDHTDLSSAGWAKEELQSQIEASLSGTPDNPISDGMRLAQLQTGTAEEQTLATMLDRFQRLTAVTEDINRRLRKAERREEIKDNTRSSRGLFGGGVRIFSDDDDLTQREYEPVKIFSGDLTDEEKVELLNQIEANRGAQSPIDLHGDPEAS
jgi:hypothetical protein